MHRRGDTPARILIIEDERGLTEVLTYNLQREGYETVVAQNAPPVERVVRRHRLSGSGRHGISDQP